MRMRMTLGVGLTLIALGLGSSGTAAENQRTWNFDDGTVGRSARGFRGFVGTWTVVDSDEGKALAQSAKNPNPVFNIVLADDTRARDLDLSVRFKAIAGADDQGGGLVWRAVGANDYYLARYNPLEDNFRVYKVVLGKRTLLQNASIAHADGWHALGVSMRGDHITCSYDGKKYLDVQDTTFPDPGKIGLWSKADAQTQFDNLTLDER